MTNLYSLILIDNAYIDIVSSKSHSVVVRFSERFTEGSRVSSLPALVVQPVKQMISDSEKYVTVEFADGRIVRSSRFGLYSAVVSSVSDIQSFYSAYLDRHAKSITGKNRQAVLAWLDISLSTEGIG